MQSSLDKTNLKFPLNKERKSSHHKEVADSIIEKKLLAKSCIFITN